MIKSLSKLLNNRILLQKQFNRFTAPKQTEDDVPIDEELVEDGKQQAETMQKQAQAVEGVQGLEGSAPEVVEAAELEEDPYQGLTLLQSNWKDIAPLIHTTYFHDNNNPLLHRQVKKKLKNIEAMYNLDLQNLNKVKILQLREFEIRSSINATIFETNRYLQNDIAQNSRIGYSMMTGKKLRELLDSNNIQAIKQLYRNNEFRIFVIQADLGSKIVDMVVQNNFQNHFILNLLECLKGFDKEKLLKPTKNFQKIMQNIHELHELNKLKFLWKINHSVEGGKDFMRYNIINHELAKIKFDGFDAFLCEKTLRNIYSGVLGNEAMKKLINYSLNKYTSSFNHFIQFWATFNLLMSRLVNLNETSIANPNSLNALFNLFELNFEEPKDLLTQVIPEVLFETKNKMLFEIYRVHVKHWVQRKADSNIPVVSGPFDEFVNNKIDFEESIQVSYNPWTTQSYFPTRSFIRTSKNAPRVPQKGDEILSQTKMIENLIKGNYSFVLNHFLLVFNPGLDKQSFNDLRKILQQAKDFEFTDENTKAYYILKKINERFFYQSEPVAFRSEFLTEFKKIRWLERKQAEPAKPRKTLLEKNWEEDEGKYSKKKAEGRDFEQPVESRERIYSKGKKKEGALFSKKNRALFSTQKDSYSEYRQVVKQLSQQHVPAEFGFSIPMDRFTDLNTFKSEIEAKSREMTEVNHKAVLNMNHLPIVGSGANLMKYLFLKKPEGQVSRIDENLKKKLRVSFVSEIGALQKDFSQYLEGCRFKFALAEQVYVTLLQDQKSNYVRKSFKTIVSHMIAYRRSLTDTEVQLICDICKKYRIGITLIEIYSLLIENRIQITRQAIYVMCDSLQKFKKINGDIFLMTKKYCENISVPFETNMLSSYVRSLLIEQQDEKLMELCETLKTELRPKPYKLKPELSAEENIKQQKEYKQFQKVEYNRILNEIINMVVMNVNNKLPEFVSALFDEYEKTQTKLQPKEIAISLIVYCNNVDKFMQILRSLKAEPSNIILTTFECAIKALRLNTKELEMNAEEIFNVTLFTHNFMLNEDLIMRSVQIFKFINSPTVFIKFLQYLLRFNPPLNYEIKSGMYFVMNGINDDFAKNTISGLLDFIFNSNRQKERQEYRKAQIEQETKMKLLEDIEKKQFFFTKSEHQKERIVADIEAGNLEDATKPKKNKSLQKQNVDKTLKEQKNKVQNPASVKTEKRKISLKSEDSTNLSIEPSDGVIRKSTVKRKLRNKSLNTFEEMFAQKEEVIEQIKGAKGQKGGKQPQQKDQKKGK